MSPVRQVLAENLFFPAEDILRKTPISRYYRFYQKAQWWSREKTEAYKKEALGKLIKHAYLTVPFYRHSMDRAGVSPSDIQSPKDLVALPFLTRQDVIENLDQLVSASYKTTNLVKGASSGSTGRVVISYHTKEEIGASFGAERIGWEMAGYRFGSRRVIIWGNRLTVEEQWTRWGSRLKNWVYQNHRIGAYKLTDEREVRDALLDISEYRPDYLWGYPNAIYFLALKANELGFKQLKCSGVLTTAETVSDYQRDIIGNVFGPVYDGYGCGEISGVAYECAASGLYHLIEPRVIAEYIPCEENANYKELVLTNLDNYGMPLIRYKVGDLVIPSDEDCTCGREWSRLKRIVGRTSDLITTPSGGALLIPSFFGSSLIRLLPHIQQYQVAKVSWNKVVIRIRAEPRLLPIEEVLIKDKLAQYLAGKMEYEVEQVDTIQLTKAGKIKLVIDETMPKSD
jgi:phenylacetate-CoA ligase